MTKIRQINKEFADHKKQLMSQNEKMLKASIEEMENVVISEDMQKTLDSLQNKSVVEVDGKDITDILDMIGGMFDVKKMLEPYAELFKGAREEAADSFIGAFELDEDVYSKERVIKILEDVLDFFKERFMIDITNGLTDKDMEKILKNPCLEYLPIEFRKILFGEAVAVQTTKYINKMQKALFPIQLMASKDSIDAYIDQQEIEAELMLSQEKLIVEANEKIKANEEYGIRIFRDIVEAVKKDNPNIVKLDRHNSITINYSKRISLYEILIEVLSETEVSPELKNKVNLTIQGYKERIAIYRRVIGLDFMRPIKNYKSVIDNFKNNDKKMNEVMGQIDNFVIRLSKYGFTIPFPGYKETDKSFGDLRKSMVSYYQTVLERYHRDRIKMLEENPGLDLPILEYAVGEDGAMVEDFGAPGFSYFILLVMSRYDKTFTKKVDFKNEKEKALEFYLSFELMSNLGNDTFILAKIIKECNEF